MVAAAVVKPSKPVVVRPLTVARARWKIGNEHNNVLKHHGYNLEYNFGHEKEHVNEVFCQLNLLAFLFHGIQALTKDEYRRAQASFGRKGDFFWALRYETARYFHKNWHDQFLTISGIALSGMSRQRLKSDYYTFFQ
jgi:hypothetical protein